MGIRNRRFHTVTLCVVSRPCRPHPRASLAPAGLGDKSRTASWHQWDGWLSVGSNSGCPCCQCTPRALGLPCIVTAKRGRVYGSFGAACLCSRLRPGGGRRIRGVSGFRCPGHGSGNLSSGFLSSLVPERCLQPWGLSAAPSPRSVRLRPAPPTPRACAGS